MSVSLIDGHLDDAPGMTDNEIIKALECCKNGLCANCPRLNTPEHILHCKEQLMCEALDLINRQKAEIERLNGNLFVISNACMQRRNEAIQEFADRLADKADLIKVNAFDSKLAISQEVIDNLVKEMVGVESG